MKNFKRVTGLGGSCGWGDELWHDTLPHGGVEASEVAAGCLLSRGLRNESATEFRTDGRCIKKTKVAIEDARHS